MPVFNYKARDKKGNLETGSIEAPSEQGAAEILASKRLVLTGLRSSEDGFNLKRIFRRYSTVSLKHLMVFSKQLSVMVNSGMPIVDSLKTLAEEETNVKFAEIIYEIAKNIEGGSSLSASLAKYPDVFSMVYANMIKAGEASGKLDVVLLKLSEQLEKDFELRAKIKGAMIYPIFILTTLVTVGVLTLSFVIPRLKPILETGGVKLPALTRSLIFVTSASIRACFNKFIVIFFIKGWAANETAGIINGRARPPVTNPKTAPGNAVIITGVIAAIFSGFLSWLITRFCMSAIRSVTGVTFF